MKNIVTKGESFLQFKKRMKNDLAVKTKLQERHFIYASCMKNPIQECVILFESNNGLSMEGDPKVIFDQLIQDEKYAKYQFVWVVKSENVKKVYVAQYSQYHCVRFIVMETKEHLNYLATSKYLISDTRFYVCFIRREEQVYIQTNNRFVNFRKGYNQTENSMNTTRMEVKDLLSSSILLSPSTYYSENIFEKDFKLENIYEGRVVETVSPRHEMIRNLSQQEAKDKCVSYGLNLEKKQILLTFGKPVLFKQKVEFCKKLKAIVSSEYQVCVKVPSSEFTKINNELKNTDILVLKNIVDMNIWLAAVDYMVGDGAGYTFDFLATGRMILFTDLYSIYKGQVYSEEELPGPTAHTPEDIVHYLENENKLCKQYEKNYKSFVKKFVFSDLDNVKQTLFVNGEINTNIGRKLKHDKEKLLFVAPLAKRNSENCGYWQLKFFQLLHRIDYNKYDVTVVSDRPDIYQEEVNIQKYLGKNIRFFYRTGFMVRTEKEYIEYKYLVNNLLYADDVHKAISLIETQGCNIDWIRIFGNVSFDTAIYFGPPVSYFLIMLNNLDVKEKIYYDQRDYNKLFPSNMGSDKSQKKFNNLFKIMNIFDKIVHPSKDVISFLKEFDAYENYSNHIAESVPITSEGKVTYQNQVYDVNESIVFEDGQLELILSKQ